MPKGKTEKMPEPDAFNLLTEGEAEDLNDFLIEEKNLQSKEELPYLPIMEHYSKNETIDQGVSSNQRENDAFRKGMKYQEEQQRAIQPIVHRAELDDPLGGKHIESDNNVKSVAKQLFNSEDIDLKTEVNHDEINNLTRLRFMEKKFEIQNVDVLINSFLRLRVSKDRKSRAEFVSALQAENKPAPNSNIWSRLFGAGGNNQ